MTRYSDKLIKSPKEWLDSYRFSVILLPIFIFLALTNVAIIAGLAVRDSADKTTQQAMYRYVNEDSYRATAKLKSYGLLTTSFAGLLQNGDIDSSSWSQYVAAFEIEKNYPSVFATGFSQSSVAVNGRNYIYPTTAETQNLAGYANNSAKQDTISRAARTGQTLMTPAIPTADDNSRSIIYIITPVYSGGTAPIAESDRIARYMGMVYIAFDASNFFDQLYRDNNEQVAHLAISQGNTPAKTTLYQKGVNRQSGYLTHEQNLEMFGQAITYNYKFYETELTSTTQRIMLNIFPTVGVVFALLFAIAVSAQMDKRSKRLVASRDRELSAAKDDLLSLASHQLRTPATGVKQYLGMVLQGFAGDISDQQRQFLEKAYDSNERQLHTINDILHLAKLESQRIILSKTKVDLVGIIKSLAGELEGSIRESNIRLSLKLPKKALAKVDPHIFRMIVENLFTNAIKYTNPKGKVTISLAKVGKRYVISVSDTGVGIQPKDFDKLFILFSRITNKRSSKVSGTGVGLYLAKNFAQLHGGDVSVESTPEKGSKFTINIPTGM